MKLKYTNQLTDDEIKEIFIGLAKDYWGSHTFKGDCTIQRKQSSIMIKGSFDTVVVNGKNFPYSIALEFDDFRVDSCYFEINWDMTLDYRKYMFDKYGTPYAVDCLLYDCDEVE